MIVLDQTQPCDTYIHGPSDLLAHAYPDNSLIALCGHTRTPDAAAGAGRKCPDCLHEAGRKHWVGR